MDFKHLKCFLFESLRFILSPVKTWKWTFKRIHRAASAPHWSECLWQITKAVQIICALLYQLKLAWKEFSKPSATSTLLDSYVTKQPPWGDGVCVWWLRRTCLDWYKSNSSSLLINAMSVGGNRPLSLFFPTTGITLLANACMRSTCARPSPSHINRAA